jgi:hypothetical protein
VERMKKVRIDKEIQIESEKKLPGSGCVWKNQSNIPIKKKFNAIQTKQSPNQTNIKSLKKVRIDY